MSQSFSPGDHKTPPRHRLRSSQNAPTVVWEGEQGEASTLREADAPVMRQESTEEHQCTGEEGVGLPVQVPTGTYNLFRFYFKKWQDYKIKGKRN